MNAKEIIDQVIDLSGRQDLNDKRTSRLIPFLNIVRMRIIRDNDIPKFYTYLENVTVTNGKIDTLPLHMKGAKTVEYKNGAEVRALKKLASYQEARLNYPDFTVTGTPAHYLELGTDLIILPGPVAGSIGMLVDAFPADLTDSITSADLLTREIGDVLVYHTLALLWLFLNDNENASVCKALGDELFAKYLLQIASQYTQDTDKEIDGYYSLGGYSNDYR